MSTFTDGLGEREVAQVRGGSLDLIMTPQVGDHTSPKGGKERRSSSSDQ